MSRIVKHELSRREFVGAVSAAGALAMAAPQAAHADPSQSPATSGSFPLKGRIFKTLKIGMVAGGGSLTEKFASVRAAGFDGIEMDSPGMDVEETKKATAATGLPVDGTVISTHWKIRHSSSKAENLAAALEHLKQAIRDTRAVGGNTVLLVVGHGDDGPEQEVWDRSLENIAQALPLAARLGIYIAIENVWNKFLYDHDGDQNQTAERFAKYIDQLNSPYVGMQFDIGNHWKYGRTGDWIRTLGRRIVKLDLKGFSRTEDKFKNIGDGDIDWTDVRKALTEINYYGWAAAEVGGGDAKRLREISQNMDRVLGL